MELFGENGEYEFGYEPRIILIEETYAIRDVRTPIFASGASAGGTTSQDVIMGFSIDRLVHYECDKTLKLLGTIPVAKLSGVFGVGFAFALRLPATVELVTPDIIEPTRDFFIETSLTPRNFDASDYERLGLPALDGHEFVAKAELGLKVHAGILLFGTEIKSFDKEWGYFFDAGKICEETFDIDCSDFTTPFGIDENGVPRQFPIPDLLIPPEVTQLQVLIPPNGFVDGFIGAGLRVNPDFGSDKITADWSLVGNGIEEPTIGVVTYLEATPSRFEIGPVRAMSGGHDETLISEAFVNLDDFKFYVDRLILNLGANLQFKGNIIFFGDRHLQTAYFDFLSFDIADILPGAGLWIPQHEGTSGVSANLEVISGAGIPKQCRPFASADNEIVSHELSIVNGGNIPIQVGDDVSAQASFDGVSDVDRVRFLWYDGEGELVRQHAATKGIEGSSWSVIDTFAGVYGPAHSEWKVIACYEDARRTIRINTAYVDIGSFFVVPESPYGVITLIASSALVFFVYTRFNHGKMKGW